jgi:hypothetical protein
LAASDHLRLHDCKSPGSSGFPGQTIGHLFAYHGIHRLNELRIDIISPIDIVSHLAHPSVATFDAHLMTSSKATLI